MTERSGDNDRVLSSVDSLTWPQARDAPVKKSGFRNYKMSPTFKAYQEHEAEHLIETLDMEF